MAAPWQWLGLDLRGPLPQTLSGHRYVLSVTDYFSKWVEAVPVESCLPSCVATHIVDVIAHFGFPLRILSRLPHDIVQKVSEASQEVAAPFRVASRNAWLEIAFLKNGICVMISSTNSQVNSV